jgi:hypothetical protein
VVETPEQHVARLEAELARAKVDALQKELAAAQEGTAQPQFGSAQPQFGGARFGVQFDKTPPPDTNLAQPPRPVPSAYRLVAIPFAWWTLFALFMIAVAPIALWIFVPVAAAMVGALTFLGVLVLSLRRSALRLSLLKWGEVAQVVDRDVKSVGTYYSGTAVQNVRMAQAHGWTVERRWYSGPVTKTGVDYELRGTRASLTLRGLPYDGGVILADSRDPRRALCVSSFPYDLERDPSGNWTGRIPTRVKVGSIVMIDLLLIWTAGMVFLGGHGANLW